jgi:hypothetical protein
MLNFLSTKENIARRDVILSEAKDLGPASKILRGVYTECNECAQDDTIALRMKRKDCVVTLLSA